MAANPRGSMRPNGRSPPFLAIGLCVALVILGFNYWSLSARNGEQANEIALMESELRLVNAKKTSSEKRGEALSDKVADLEKEISSQKEIIASKMSELQSVKQVKEECAQKVNDMEGDRVTMNDKLDVCEAEKSSLMSEAEQLKGDAESLKNKQCEASDCETFSKQSREQTLRDINRVAGNGPLIDLYKMGGDVGQFAEQLKELAALAQNNAPIQGGANNQQQQQQQEQVVDMNPQQPNAVISPQVGGQGNVQGGGQGGGQGEGQGEVKNEQSQTNVETQDSGLQQQQQQSDNKKDEADEVKDSAQVARPDVNELSETGRNGLSKSNPTTANNSYTTKTVEQGNQTSYTTEASTSLANHAFTNSTNGDGNDMEAQLFPPQQGDGINPDEDDENDDDYDDEDDDDIDEALKLGAADDKDIEDEDEDYDYDDDDADEADYRYNDNEDQRDVEGNDNTIEQMYQQDKQGQP